MTFVRPQCLSLRQTAEAVHLAETPGLDIDTAALFTTSAPWVLHDGSKTRSRKYTIEAHHQYLKLMHHIPLAIDPSDFEYVVKSIHSLVCVGDAYDSLSIMSTPVENFLIRYHSSNIETLSNTNYKKLLAIAMKIRSRWLLREIVCRIIGDPLWEDHDLERNFSDSNAGDLLLSKRAKMQDMLKAIERGILLIQQPKKTRGIPDECVTRFATAAFRDEISRLFNSHRKGDWVSYARKFRLLKEYVLRNIGTNWKNQYPYWFDRLYDKFGRPGNIDRGAFSTVVQLLQGRTAEVIKPLFECVVQQPSTELSKRDASY